MKHKAYRQNPTVEGNVFHASEGKACPIYRCCANKHRLTNCGSCADVPCDTWKMTRDPSMTESEFEFSIQERIKHLKGVSHYGI